MNKIYDNAVAAHAGLKYRQSAYFSNCIDGQNPIERYSNNELLFTNSTIVSADVKQLFACAKPSATNRNPGYLLVYCDE